MSGDVIAYPAYRFGHTGAGHPEWQRDFRLDDQPVARGLSRHVSPELADLLDIAVAVHVTDRLRPRRPLRARDDGQFWSRRLPLQVAVRRPELWTSGQVTQTLQELLAWLTDDFWELEFVGDPAFRRFSETQPPLFHEPLREPVSVGLMSGGLDSALGAERDLHDGQGDLLLVSAAGSGRTKGLQRAVTRQLAPLGARRVRPFVIEVGLTAAGKQLGEAREESSQRSRGFLFLSLGAAVAATAQVSELRVYENGPGALNLPLSSAQRGSMNTRAMRPETLVLMQQLLSLILNRPFVISNPNFWMTKAEMCRSAPSRAAPLIAETISCDSGLTRRDHEHPLCGICTSCLLRRQSLLAARLRQLDSADVQRMPGDALAAPARHAAASLKMMLAQVLALETALAQPQPWAALIDSFPELASARRALGCPASDLMDLLSRYARDWRAVDRPIISQLLGPARAEVSL